ncbi:cyclin-dependent serine/threonine protein kinase [Gonapodya sp. JEL0774]|nr:cyclin-dependent serine/threonine protein kinase [Gonapodya sp. JEL0774]
MAENLIPLRSQVEPGGSGGVGDSVEIKTKAEQWELLGTLNPTMGAGEVVGGRALKADRRNTRDLKRKRVQGTAPAVGGGVEDMAKNKDTEFVDSTSLRCNAEKRQKLVQNAGTGTGQSRPRQPQRTMQNLVDFTPKIPTEAKLAATKTPPKIDDPTGEPADPTSLHPNVDKRQTQGNHQGTGNVRSLPRQLRTTMQSPVGITSKLATKAQLGTAPIQLNVDRSTRIQKLQQPHATPSECEVFVAQRGAMRGIERAAEEPSGCNNTRTVPIATNGPFQFGVNNLDKAVEAASNTNFMETSDTKLLTTTQCQLNEKLREPSLRQCELHMVPTAMLAEVPRVAKLRIKGPAMPIKIRIKGPVVSLNEEKIKAPGFPFMDGTKASANPRSLHQTVLETGSLCVAEAPQQLAFENQVSLSSAPSPAKDVVLGGKQKLTFVDEDLGDFIIGGELGQGTSGVVKLGVIEVTGFRESLGSPREWAVVALKYYRRKGINGKVPGDARAEKAILEQHVHENLANFLGQKIVVGTNQLTKTVTVNMFEYVSMDLSSIIQQFRAAGKIIPLQFAQSLFVQLMRVLADLHDEYTLHADVKPPNVLIGMTGILKLGDFGLARQTNMSGRIIPSVSAPIGTKCYLAPELLLKGLLGVDGSYGLDVDLYAAGMTIAEVLVGFRVGMPHPRKISVWRDIMEDTISSRPLQGDGLRMEFLRFLMNEPACKRRTTSAINQFCLNRDPFNFPASGEQMSLRINLLGKPQFGEMRNLEVD